MADVQLGSHILIVFPTILIFEILLLLPVRSLLRFRCVCKEWCELIDSHLFKDTYLAIRRAMDVDNQIVGLKSLEIEIPSPEDNNDPVVVDEIRLRRNFAVDSYRHVNYKYSMTCWYDDYESLFFKSTSAPSSDIFQLPGNYPDTIMIVGHVNGVVCLIHRDTEYNERRVNPARLVDGEYWFDIRLVNPALREIRKLPDPMFDLFGFCSGGIKLYETHRIGFGYDDVSDDYKVVVIVTVFEDNSLYKYIAMVYYLSTNSWKILGDMSQFVSRTFERQRSKESVFCHGSIHWCMGSFSESHEDGTLDHCILVFNVTDELFREMPFPQHRHGWISYSVFSEKMRSPHLFMVDKSTLALVCRTHTRPIYHPPGFEIWVMNDYGDPDSWTKQISIDEMYEAVFFWKKDKLFLSTEDRDLICYDLSKRQWDLVESEFEIWRRGFVTGHESLVSVKQV